MKAGQRTLYIGNALLENLLKNLGVLELLLDLANDSLGKLLLLALLDLSLVAHPRIENLLGFGSEGSALLELVGLSLELGGFLWCVSIPIHEKLIRKSNIVATNLGNFEKLLGDLNNTAELLDVLHTRLDGVGVVATGRVQNVFVLLRLTLCPLSVGGTAVLAEGSEYAEQTEGDDGFLVQHVKLVADGGDRQTGTGRQNGGLGNQRVSGKRVNDRLRLLRGFLSRHV